MQWRWGNRDLLIEYLQSIPVKGWPPAEPLIDHNPERVLIARRWRLPLDVLGGPVVRCAGPVLRLQRGRAVRGDSDARVPEQEFPAAAQQYILRFDIAMDQLSSL